MADSSDKNTIIHFDKLHEDIKKLIKIAVKTREFSYCPYSNFSVGAALLTDQNLTFSGCNVESKAYSPSICAERTAVCKAVSEGHTKFVAVAVVAYQEDCFTTPCGVCREVLSEFGGDTLDIYMTKPDMEYVMHMKLSQLLPLAFKL